MMTGVVLDESRRFHHEIDVDGIVLEKAVASVLGVSGGFEIGGGRPLPPRCRPRPQIAVKIFQY